jgi:DNA-binding CsgD family transcriptional regulator
MPYGCDTITARRSKEEGLLVNQAQLNPFSFVRYLGATGAVVCLSAIIDGSALQSGFLSSDLPSQYFLVASILAFVVCCLYFTVAFAFSLRNPGRWVNFGGLIAGASFAAFMIFPGRESSNLIAAAFGALFGIGLCATCVAWGIAFKAFAQQQAFKTLSMVFIAAALLRAILLLLVQPWSNLCLALLLGCASIIPNGKTGFDEGPISDESPAERVSGMFQRNWIILSALIPSILLSAFSWSGNIRGMAMLNNPQVETSWGITVGFLMPALLFLWLSVSKRKTSISLLATLLPLLCVTILLISWFLGAFQGGFYQVLTNIPVGFLTASVVILLVVRLIAEMRNGLAAAFVTGLFGAICATLFLICYGIWPFLNDSIASGISLSIEVLYLALVAIRLAVFAQVKPISNMPDQEKSISEKCAEFGNMIALSKREKEILLLLAQGRSAPYIAESQFVSANTVRTHIKRMYTKANVHSREELLDQIYKI